MEMSNVPCYAQLCAMKTRSQYFTVTVPHHQASGKRNYTHPQACLFCKKIISSKMRRHYLSVHTDRSLVQKIISEKEKHQKDMKINHLINKGNFQHNAEVAIGVDRITHSARIRLSALRI